MESTGWSGECFFYSRFVPKTKLSSFIDRIRISHTDSFGDEEQVCPLKVLTIVIYQDTINNIRLLRGSQWGSGFYR